MKSLPLVLLALMLMTPAHASDSYSRLLAQRNVMAGNLFSLPGGEGLTPLLVMINDQLADARARHVAYRTVLDHLAAARTFLCDQTVRPLQRVYDELLSKNPETDSGKRAKALIESQKMAQSIEPFIAYCNSGATPSLSGAERAQYLTFGQIYRYSLANTAAELARTESLMEIPSK